MRPTFVAAVAVGAVGAAGLGVALPALASSRTAGTASPTPSATATATPGSTAGPSTGRAQAVTRVKQALAGLVKAGTLTQAQADAVAGTLADTLARDPFGRGRHFGGPGGPGDLSGWHGGRIDGIRSATETAAAQALGLSVAQLRTARENGTTLAALAKTHHVGVDSLVSTMVAAAKKQLAAAVTAGQLTKARADQISGSLTARITDRVDDVGPRFGDRGARRAAPDGSNSTTPGTGTGAGAGAGAGTGTAWDGTAI